MQDTIDPAFKTKPNFMGIAAGGGLVSGVAVFSAEHAVNCNVPCILVRKETDPDDIAGMNAAKGILTSTGGMTSHAAVVARGMNKACVVGATDLVVTPTGASIGKEKIKAGQHITIDGNTGAVWIGIQVPVIPGGGSKEVKAVVSWANEGTVSERLEVSGHMTAKALIQAVQTAVSKSIYVDTALFETQDFNTLSGLKDNMENLRVALETSEAEEVVLDLSCITHHLPKVDSMFFLMFKSDYYEASLVDVKADIISKWGQKLKDIIVVKLPKVPAGSPVYSVLAKAGIKVMGQATTFADLLNASGPVQVSDEIIASVFGNVEAFEMAKKMIEEKTGKSLSGSMPEPRYWYQLLSAKVA